MKIEWRCEFFRQILSFLTTISILESNIFIRGTVIVEEEREKEDIYIYIRTSNKYLLFRRYIIFASFRSHGVNNKFHAVSNIFSGSLKGCKINGQRKGKRELLVSAWRERERGGAKKGKSETESFPPVYFSTLEKNKSLRFSLRNEGGKRGKNEKGERKRLLLADPV